MRLAVACMLALVAVCGLTAAGAYKDAQASPEMQAAHRLMECFSDGDVACMDDGTSDSCHGHVESMKGVLPYKTDYEGKSCLSDRWKDFGEVWEAKDIKDVKWFQGEERTVAATSYLHLKWRSEAKDNSNKEEHNWDEATMYHAVELEFDEDNKVVSWHCVQDSAYDWMMMRHKRDSAAEKWAKAFEEDDLDSVQDMVSDDCVGIEEGPKDMMPWLGKYTGKSCISDYFKRYGEYFEITDVKDTHLTYPKHIKDGIYVLSGTIVRRVKEDSGIIDRLLGRKHMQELSGSFNARLEFDEDGMLVKWHCMHDDLAEYMAMRAAGRLGAENDIKVINE